jgi:hypothetical protein
MLLNVMVPVATALRELHRLPVAVEAAAVT